MEINQEVKKEFHWDLPKELPSDPRGELVYKFPMEKKVLDVRGRVWEWYIFEGKMTWRPLAYMYVENMIYFKNKLAIFRNRKKKRLEINIKDKEGKNHKMWLDWDQWKIQQEFYGGTV